MLDICAAVLFVNSKQACVARCYMQEEGTNNRMVVKCFEGSWRSV